MLQIIFDVILIALFGYPGFTGEIIDLLVALLWFICLWLHIYELNRFYRVARLGCFCLFIYFCFYCFWTYWNERLKEK